MAGRFQLKHMLLIIPLIALTIWLVQRQRTPLPQSEAAQPAATEGDETPPLATAATPQSQPTPKPAPPGSQKGTSPTPAQKSPQLTDLLAALATNPLFGLLDQPRTYEGRSLFKHINGGAEVYLELGFTLVATAEVAAANSQPPLQFTVDIFEMNTPAAARSIFDQEKPPQPTVSTVGEQGYADAYSQVFVRSRYYVKITTVTANQHSQELARTLAGQVDSQLSRSRDG